MNLDPLERRYQVFISSTLTDLEEERKKVLQAVLELHAFPAGMELFPAADEEQWEFIKREIDSSDYYIVILAGKYGSLAQDGISFTEKEYDYAKERGKQVIAFLYRNLDDLRGKYLEADEKKREKLMAFHDKAKKSKLVRFFSNAEELKSSVLMSLVQSFQMKPAEGWVRAKNARRIEDLEELTTLQKRLRSLEEENAELRSERLSEADQLSQGQEKIPWSVELQAATIQREIVAPPVQELRLEVTWDQLFVAAFNRSMPNASLAEVTEGIADIALKRVSQDWPANGWRKQHTDRLRNHRANTSLEFYESNYWPISI